MSTFELTVTLQQGTFLLDVSMQAEGRALALFGPSGSGKTTLIETIAGLRTPQRGRIAMKDMVFLDSANAVDLPSRGRRVGYVPQDVLLFPHFNVGRNLTYGQREKNPSAHQHVLEILELEPMLDRNVSSLSGGERQRVAIGRALLSDPAVLLLDEPLAAVDQPRRRRITSALLRVRDELGVPLVYVTHAAAEAMTIADHAVVLEAGHVVSAGAPADVLSAVST